MPDRDYIKEAAEYRRGERRALPDIELVVALLNHIDDLKECIEIRDALLAQMVSKP